MLTDKNFAKIAHRICPAIFIICILVIANVSYCRASVFGDFFYGRDFGSYDDSYSLDFPDFDGRARLIRTANYDDIVRYYRNGISAGLAGNSGRREIVALPGFGFFSMEYAESGFWSDQSAKEKSYYTGDTQKYLIDLDLKAAGLEGWRVIAKRSEANYFGLSSLDANIMQYFVKLPYNNVRYGSDFVKFIRTFEKRNGLKISLGAGFDNSVLENIFDDTLKCLSIPFKNRAPVYSLGFSKKSPSGKSALALSFELIRGSNHNDFYKGLVPSLGENTADRETKSLKFNYRRNIGRDKILSVAGFYYDSCVKNVGRLETGVINPLLNLTSKSYRYFLDFSQKSRGVNISVTKKYRRTIDVTYGLHYSKQSYKMPFSYSRETLFNVGPFNPRSILFPEFDLYGLGFEIKKKWRGNVDISYSLWQYAPVKKNTQAAAGENISADVGSSLDKKEEEGRKTRGGTFHSISLTYKF